MKFNRIFSKQTDQDQKKRCIELEYQLRLKITKFLMQRLEHECDGDFSCFCFDVDLSNNWVQISENTPKNYIVQIKEAFDIEINCAKDALSL